MRRRRPLLQPAAALCCGLTRQGHGESSGTGAATAGGSPCELCPSWVRSRPPVVLLSRVCISQPLLLGQSAAQPPPVLLGPSGPRGAPGQRGLFHPHPKARLAAQAAPCASQLLVLLFPCPPRLKQPRSSPSPPPLFWQSCSPWGAGLCWGRVPAPCCSLPIPAPCSASHGHGTDLNPATCSPPCSQPAAAAPTARRGERSRLVSAPELPGCG